MEFLSNRGGVPVFRRPVLNPRAPRDSVIPTDPSSPILPAKIFLSPTCINPDKKVPHVKTTAFPKTEEPSRREMPETA